MDLSQLNSACSQKKIIKLQHLPENKVFPILNVKEVNTKYGSSILVELKDSVLFLPRRATTPVKENLSMFDEEKLGIKFIGMEENGTRYPVINFEFEKLK